MWRVKSWEKYILVVCLIWIQCQMFQQGAEGYCRVAGQTWNISIGDYVADFFKGTIPYSMSAKNMPFNIPGIWSLYIIYFFVLIAQAVNQMFQANGSQLTIRYTTRSSLFWHQSGILWKETVRYLVVTYAAFLFYGLFSGASFGGADANLQFEFNGLDLSKISEGMFLVEAVALPFLVMLAFAYLQYIISIRFHVMAGLVVSVAILVSSVFSLHPMLIGNYLMLMRYENALESGVTPVTGIIICAVVIAIGSVIGRRIIKKMDLF